MNGLHNHLNIAVCKDATDAVSRGFDYKRPGYEPIRIVQVVVVENGTEGGNPTVDLVMQDERGQKYVAMVTGRLMKSIPC